MRQDCNDTWLRWVASRSTVTFGSSEPARYRVGVRWEDWLGVSRGLPFKSFAAHSDSDVMGRRDGAL